MPLWHGLVDFLAESGLGQIDPAAHEPKQCALMVLRELTLGDPAFQLTGQTVRAHESPSLLLMLASMPVCKALKALEGVLLVLEIGCGLICACQLAPGHWLMIIMLQSLSMLVQSVRDVCGMQLPIIV